VPDDLVELRRVEQPLLDEDGLDGGDARLDGGGVVLARHASSSR